MWELGRKKRSSESVQLASDSFLCRISFGYDPFNYDALSAHIECSQETSMAERERFADTYKVQFFALKYLFSAYFIAVQITI